MGDTTKISWADHTASPWFGCSAVSAGCANCYARELTLRKHWAGWGDEAPRIASKGFWKEAYKWNRLGFHCAGCGAAFDQPLARCPSHPTASLRRARVFTSLVDPFDAMAAGAIRNGQPIDRLILLANFFKVVMECQNLDWLLLTKRPENVMPTLGALVQLCAGHFMECGNLGGWLMGWMDGVAVPQNVWLGVTVENQEAAWKRLPVLVGIPAAVRWLSVEPLLEPVNLMLMEREGGTVLSAIGRNVHWVVVGGESGPKRRDCGVEAIQSVAWQCQAAAVPVFVKQDCAARAGQQGRIPDEIWKLKDFPIV